MQNKVAYIVKVTEPAIDRLVGEIEGWMSLHEME